MSRSLRAGLVTLLMAAALVVVAPAAHAESIPQTLAQRRPVGLGAVEPAFAIDYVGVFWDVPAGRAGHAHAADGEHGHRAAPHGEIRLRYGSRWSAWKPLVEDGAQASGRWTGSLVPAADAGAYQLRGLPADAIRPQAVALNTTDGPAREIRTRPVSAQALPACVSRHDWGADETLGSKTGRAFADVQVMTVHHTATANDDTDPKATVRAIHRYHTVDNGWDDIGYNYLIDGSGRLYEGRWSGADSVPCESGPGDGTDFAHNEVDQLVTGAHSGGYNTGNIGVALLGNFNASGTEPRDAAITALEDTLAELGDRHGFTPSQLRGDELISYDNGTNAKSVHAISAHRDFSATDCPGQRLYDRLPTIRDHVAASVEGGGPAPDPAPDPAPSIHVGRLSGRSTRASARSWDATATVLAHESNEQPAGNVSVTGVWADGTTATCSTNGSGVCQVTLRVTAKKVKRTTFTVRAISRGTDTYDAAANHDPAGTQPSVTITAP